MQPATSTVLCRVIPAALLTLSGCFSLLPRAPVNALDGDFSSPLDEDLRAAVATANKEFPHMGEHWNVHVRWAGVLGGAPYRVDRDPATGRPLRQLAPVIYAWDGAADGKCFLSRDLHQATAPDVFLVRENLGGDHYGPPHIGGSPPINGQGKPTGSEIVCAGADSAKGGIHVQAQADEGPKTVAASATSTHAHR
jgi:hypothetical protein